MTQSAFDQQRVRHVALEAIARGPCSLAQISTAMQNTGVPVGLIYFAARMAVNQLIAEHQVEVRVYHNGDTVWQLPTGRVA